MIEQIELENLPQSALAQDRQSSFDRFPWWLLALIGFLVAMAVTIWQSESYSESFDFIISGIRLTMYTTLVAFGVALLIGLFVGLGRISHNVVIRNLRLPTSNCPWRADPCPYLYGGSCAVPAVSGPLSVDNRLVSGNTRCRPGGYL